jgi:hypothetical protein
MRDFSKVSPLIWESVRFRNLPDDDARLLYLYFLTNSHQNSVGCYKLPAAYACADMSWDEPRYQAALTALVTAELIETDGATREILIPRWFKHNPPTNAKHMLGSSRLVDKIESPALRTRATGELRTAWTRWQASHPPASEAPHLRAVAGSR